ncbi:MAG: hypothetical protein LUB61_01590 [Eggerthellaceae bacterium]|nr:hypothetical protein [Eggerthellaceae bacterium]
MDASSWYSGYFQWACDSGYKGGYAGTTSFGPFDELKRVKLAIVLVNYASGYI